MGGGIELVAGAFDKNPRKSEQMGQVTLQVAQLGDDAVFCGAGRLALPSKSESPASSSELT
jgi:hypothetical protein